MQIVRLPLVKSCVRCIYFFMISFFTANINKLSYCSDERNDGFVLQNGHFKLNCILLHKAYHTKDMIPLPEIECVCLCCSDFVATTPAAILFMHNTLEQQQRIIESERKKEKKNARVEQIKYVTKCLATERLMFVHWNLFC